VTGIRNARKRSGLTLEELGRKAGISASHVAALEGGRARLTYRAMQRLARALNVPAGTLLPGRRGTDGNG
jgi:transcriptional regulator with XRE-family HTH domain